MKELRQKQRFKGYLYSIPALILLVVVAFLLARGAAGIFAKERQSAQVLEDLREDNAVLAKREESLKQDIASLRTEEGIIEEIRRKFNVTRPGEHLAIVLEEKPRVTNTSTGAFDRFKMGWSWFLGLWGK